LAVFVCLRRQPESARKISESMSDVPEEKKPPVPPKPAEPAGTPPAGKPAEGGAPAAPPKPAAPAAAAPPRPPAPPKEGPLPLDNELVKRYKARFGDAIKEAWTDRKQAIVVVAPEQLTEIAQYTRDDEQFDLLVDLTAVDWPKREKRFELVLILYSFAKNERLRIKAQVGEGEGVPTVSGIWPTADWLEREVYDMFGVTFSGHPRLTRLLLPEEWEGFPLRKDYDILQQDDAWVRENLGIESGQ
jgi:NADH-quinone oxidoreductase subunit C